MKAAGRREKAKKAGDSSLLPFQLSVHAALGKEFVPYLRKHLRAARRLLAGAPGEISIALVGDGAMAELHWRFLGINSPTDVLTFELEHDAAGRTTGGEVVICVPQAKRQAKGAARDEVLLCALHGILHLCGMDDKTKRGFAAMHEAEDRILARLGVGRVFAPNGPKTRRIGSGR